MVRDILNSDALSSPHYSTAMKFLWPSVKDDRNLKKTTVINRQLFAQCMS